MIENFDPRPIITSILKPLGYKKDGNYWVLELDTHFVYLILYASSYGDADKYIDVRASVKQLMDAQKKYKRDWHADTRIYELKQLNGALTYSHEYKDLNQFERASRLEKGLREFAVKKLEQLQTFEGIVQLWNDSPLLTSPELRQLLGIADKEPHWSVLSEQQKSNQPKGLDSLGFHRF